MQFSRLSSSRMVVPLPSSRCPAEGNRIFLSITNCIANHNVSEAPRRADPKNPIFRFLPSSWSRSPPEPRGSVSVGFLRGLAVEPFRGRGSSQRAVWNRPNPPPPSGVANPPTPGSTLCSWRLIADALPEGIPRWRCIPLLGIWGMARETPQTDRQVKPLWTVRVPRARCGRAVRRRGTGTPSKRPILRRRQDPFQNSLSIPVQRSDNTNTPDRPAGQTVTDCGVAMSPLPPTGADLWTGGFSKQRPTTPAATPRGGRRPRGAPRSPGNPRPLPHRTASPRRSTGLAPLPRLCARPARVQEARHRLTAVPHIWVVGG